MNSSKTVAEKCIIQSATKHNMSSAWHKEQILKHSGVLGTVYLPVSIWSWWFPRGFFIGSRNLVLLVSVLKVLQKLSFLFKARIKSWWLIMRLSALEPIRQISVHHGLLWFFQWKITILSHQEISHLFGPTQCFHYFTGRFSQSPKTSQFPVLSGEILVKLYGSVKPTLHSRINWLFYTQKF